MPKYRIHALSFIDNQLVKEGDEIETDATPAPHWEPLDKKAEKASAESEAAEVARIEALAANEATLKAAVQIVSDAGAQSLV